MRRPSRRFLAIAAALSFTLAFLGAWLTDAPALVTKALAVASLICLCVASCL